MRREKQGHVPFPRIKVGITEVASQNFHLVILSKMVDLFI